MVISKQEKKRLGFIQNDNIVIVDLLNKKCENTNWKKKDEHL